MVLKIRKISALLVFLALSGLIITACSPGESEVDIDIQRTGFAQTADAQATMTAQAIPTSTNTPEPSPTPAFTDTPEATETSSEVTETTEVTETPEASPTTQTSTGNDAAAWIAQDPPDNTEFTPGQEFTVTWTLENTGTSTWDTNYYIQFASGEEMGATDEKVYLAYEVPPNTSAQFSVNLVAPESTGEKQSNWRLFNRGDISFYEFYVIIDVVEEAD
jgi:hypothetical protein